ncbi:MAG: hypothetical protein ACFFDN_45495, partial [Candidatus Hodarchaeota archaeon]
MRHISSIVIKYEEPVKPVIQPFLQKKDASLPGESFKLIKFSDNLHYLFYTPGNFKYDSSSFSVAAEYFLLDDFIA